MTGKGKVLYLQLVGGISGDMFLSLMADLGVDLSVLEDIFRAHVDVKILARARRKMGFSGIMVDVVYDKNQKMRNLKDLVSIIKGLDISEDVKYKAIESLKKLALVEAKVHGTEVENVHFHEIGGLDTLVDVVGAIWCLKELEISEVYCSPIPLFEGMVECEHGKIPLPAPATLKLLKGKPVYFSNEQKEMVTPTGALILDQLVDSFNKRPGGKLIGDGYGIGHLDMSIPNILRGMVFQCDKKNKLEFQQERICELETNVDHLTGEEIGNLFDVLLKNGALDVFFLPGIMKKNRPSGILKVLCVEERLNHVLVSIFKNTLTLGIRINRIERVKLDRISTNMVTEHGEVCVKEFNFNNVKYKRPEFESLKKIGRSTNFSPVELRLKFMEKGLKSKN